jgi:four helix bundle protein
MARCPGLVPIEERTFAFGLALIRVYRASPPRDDADRVVWRQLLKSGTSAGANSAESPGSQSRREWITRRHIALKEMRESQFWLRLLHAANPGREPQPLAQLIDESGQLVAILTATLNTARKNSQREGQGSNYPPRGTDYPPT